MSLKVSNIQTQLPSTSSKVARISFDVSDIESVAFSLHEIKAATSQFQHLVEMMRNRTSIDKERDRLLPHLEDSSLVLEQLLTFLDTVFNEI